MQACNDPSAECRQPRLYGRRTTSSPVRNPVARLHIYLNHVLGPVGRDPPGPMPLALTFGGEIPQPGYDQTVQPTAHGTQRVDHRGVPRPVDTFVVAADVRLLPDPPG